MNTFFDNTLNKILNNIMFYTKTQLIRGHDQITNFHRYLLISNALLAFGYSTSSMLCPIYAKACGISESRAALNYYLQTLEKKGFVTINRKTLCSDRVLYRITQTGINELERIQARLYNNNVNHTPDFGSDYVPLSTDALTKHFRKMSMLSLSNHNHLENQIIFSILLMDPISLRGIMKEISFNELGFIKMHDAKNLSIINTDVLFYIGQCLIMAEADRNTESYKVLLHKIDYSLNCLDQHHSKTLYPGALIYIVGALDKSIDDKAIATQRLCNLSVKLMGSSNCDWYQDLFNKGIILAMFAFTSFNDSINLLFPFQFGIGSNLIRIIMRKFGFINERLEYISDCNPLFSDGHGKFYIYLRNHYIYGSLNIFIECPCYDLGSITRIKTLLTSGINLIRNTLLIIIVRDDNTIYDSTNIGSIIPTELISSGTVAVFPQTNVIQPQNHIQLPKIVLINESDALSCLNL